MTHAQELRRRNLASICRALSSYIERDHQVSVRTIVSDADIPLLAEELRGKAAVVFTIDDWDALQHLLEDENQALMDAEDISEAGASGDGHTG